MEAVVLPVEVSRSHKLSEFAFSSSIMVARAKTGELDTYPGFASEQFCARLLSAEPGLKMNKCLRSLIVLGAFSGCAVAQLAAAHEIKAIAPDCASLSRKTQVSNEHVNSLALAKGYKIIRFWEPASGKLVLWPLFFSMDPEVYADAEAAALQRNQQALGNLLLERCVPQQAPHTLLVHPTNSKAGGVSTQVR
jgi:hypothetical protein